MPTLLALSMNHDRTIVSRIRVTFSRGRPTAGRGRYTPAWPERLASGRSWLAALIAVLALVGGANAAGASPPVSARLADQGRLGLDDPISDHLAPPTLELLRRGGYDPTRSTSAICSCTRAGCTTTPTSRSSSST